MLKHQKYTNGANPIHVSEISSSFSDLVTGKLTESWQLAFEAEARSFEGVWSFKDFSDELDIIAEDASPV